MQVALTQPPRTELSLQQFMQRVVEYNESVQARLLAFQAARSQRRAETGAFEPTWVTSAEHVDSQRANTIEQERELQSGGILTERNNNYSTAVEMQTSLGTKLRLGVTGAQLHNNIQRTVLPIDAEFQTSVGVSLEQPLLKGAGHSVALAALRLAARNSEVAYQEYRRGLMSVIGDAEMAYWQLYYAQQEESLGTESVNLAQTLVRDSKAAMDAGRGSQLDVLEAEAGLAMRKSRESLSRQKRVEAQNRLQAFFGAMPTPGQAEVVAGEGPNVRAIQVSTDEGFRVALAMNPDLLKATAQVNQELIRVGYARNQRLPNLDLKSTYATTGLGFDWTSSWRDIERRDFPAWTVGLEFRVPIFGGLRGRNEFTASKLRLAQAQRVASDVRTQVQTNLDSAQKSVAATLEAAQGFGAVVEFRSNLLQTRLQGRDVGRIDTRSVLEAEQELLGARLDQLQSAVEYERALLDLQIVSGTLLQNRGVDLGFAELEKRTNEWSKTPDKLLPALQYDVPAFTRWPIAPAIPFEGDPDPGYPGRLRLVKPGERR